MREGLGKDRHRRVRGKNAVAVARKDVRTLVLFVSFRVAAKTVCERALFARWSFIFAEKPCGHRRFHRRKDREAMPIARPKSAVMVRAEAGNLARAITNFLET